MFSEFVEVRAGEAGRTRWAIAISTVVQAVLLLVLLLIPLLYTEALPKVLLGMKSLLAPPMPLVEAPKPPKVTVRTERQAERFIQNGVIYQPKGFPSKPVIFRESELPPELPADTSGGGYNGADLFNYLTTSRSEAEPPPVVPIRIPRIWQTQIQVAMILSQPQPVYPPLAVMAGIQGDVTLHAIIDREGRVAELQVVSGHPLLVQAALAAVRSWRYRPTLLNGQPVEVETTIKVNFVLGR
jgi:periplasmic protein TonB